MNCTVTEKRAALPTFEVLCGGLSLAAVDEEGYRLSEDQLKIILAFIEFSCGVKELAVLYDAPGAIDQLGKEFGAEVFRIGRDDPKAAKLYLQQTIMRDGVFAGARLCAWLKAHNEKLSELRRRMPKFSSITREVALKSSRGAVMRLMSSNLAGNMHFNPHINMQAEMQEKNQKDMTAGLRLNTDRGCVYISPLRERSALKIHAESVSEEIAEELCIEFERRAQENDK
jgi:mannose-1-phosphate guanylyltransferase/phosphomannomutase